MGRLVLSPGADRAPLQEWVTAAVRLQIAPTFLLPAGREGKKLLSSVVHSDSLWRRVPRALWPNDVNRRGLAFPHTVKHLLALPGKPIPAGLVEQFNRGYGPAAAAAAPHNSPLEPQHVGVVYENAVEDAGRNVLHFLSPWGKPERGLVRGPRTYRIWVS